MVAGSAATSRIVGVCKGFGVGHQLGEFPIFIIIIIVFSTIDHQLTSRTWPLLPVSIGYPGVDHPLQEPISGPASLEMPVQPRFRFVDRFHQAEPLKGVHVLPALGIDAVFVGGVFSDKVF